MRQASTNYGIIINNDQFIGISLGYDYCSEHEWGIKDIRRLCGIPESTKKIMGVKSRTITVCPPLVFNKTTIKKRKYAYLYTGNSSDTQEKMEKNFPYELKDYSESLIYNEEWNIKHSEDKESKDLIITAWDEHSFGIAVMGEKEISYLQELYDEFQNKNITIAVINHRVTNPFAGTALSLMITDRLPQEILDMMYAGDKEYFDREDYEEKIGMKKIIQKYGNKNGYNGLHYFMACSPNWIDYNDEKKREEYKTKYNTKYNIKYWINYSDDDNNCGWYTVEEIEKWLTGSKKLTEIRKG